MVTRAKTWYPGLDERCGTNQLLKAEIRAQEKYANEMLRIQRIRQLHVRGLCSTSASPISALMSPSAAGQQSFQRAGNRHSSHGDEGSVYSYPSSRINQGATFHPPSHPSPAINPQYNRAGDLNQAQIKEGNGQDQAGYNNQNQGMNGQNKGMGQNKGSMGQNKGGSGPNHGINNQNPGRNDQNKGGNVPNQAMLGGNGQNQGMNSQNMSGQNKGQCQNQGNMEGGKNQNQGMNNQNQGMNNQNQGMNNQNQKMNDQNQRMNNQSQGMDNHNQGMNSHGPGMINQNQGINSTKQGRNVQNKAVYGQDQRNIGKTQGKIQKKGTSLNSGNGQNQGNDPNQGTNQSQGNSQSQGNPNYNQDNGNHKQEIGLYQENFNCLEPAQNMKGQRKASCCEHASMESAASPRDFQAPKQTPGPGLFVQDVYESSPMLGRGQHWIYTGSVLSGDSLSPYLERLGRQTPLSRPSPLYGGTPAPSLRARRLSLNGLRSTLPSF